MLVHIRTWLIQSNIPQLVEADEFFLIAITHHDIDIMRRNWICRSILEINDRELGRTATD